jgi:hypothetical protein
MVAHLAILRWSDCPREREGVCVCLCVCGRERKRVGRQLHTYVDSKQSVTSARLPAVGPYVGRSEEGRSVSVISVVMTSHGRRRRAKDPHPALQVAAVGVTHCRVVFHAMRTRRLRAAVWSSKSLWGLGYYLDQEIMRRAVQEYS